MLPTAGKDMRLVALRRFAFAITLLNVLGHTVLGFEPSPAQPVVALLTAYPTEILLELLESRHLGRKPRFLGSATRLFDFLLAPHITGLAVGMLLYAGDRLLPIAFATVTAIGSKYLFRAGPAEARRHFFNPSNFGITATLLALPWMGIAQPYMFTENLSGVWDWVLPAVVVAAGLTFNAKLTGKLPLLGGWLTGFVLQAASRHFLLGNRFLAALNPMTGVAFLLFTFYMLTDPATTPAPPSRQVGFGAAVAAVYGLLMALHVVFGLFFALTLVCAGRGLLLHLGPLLAERSEPACATGNTR